MSRPWTIAEAEELLPRAKRFADELGVPYDEAPLSIGLLSSDPPSEESMKKARAKAIEMGWDK